MIITRYTSPPTSLLLLLKAVDHVLGSDTLTTLNGDPITADLTTTPKRKLEAVTTEDPKAARARTTSVKLTDYVVGEETTIDEEPIKTSLKTFEVEVR